MTNQTATTARIFMVLLLTLPLTIIPKYAFAGGGGAQKPFKWCIDPDKTPPSWNVKRLRVEVYDNINGVKKKLDTVKFNAKELENGKRECFRSNNGRISVKAYIQLKDGNKGKKCGEDSFGWSHDPQIEYVEIQFIDDDTPLNCKFK